MSSLNGVLDASLLAANVSLEVLAATKREIEAQLERKTLEAEKIAVRAGHNACWAEAEGMRAEEAVSRRFLADTVAAETVRRVPCVQKVYGREEGKVVPTLSLQVFLAVRERLLYILDRANWQPNVVEGSASMQGPSKTQHCGQTDNKKAQCVFMQGTWRPQYVFVDLYLVAAVTDTDSPVGRRDSLQPWCSNRMVCLMPGACLAHPLRELRSTWYV